MNWRPIKEQPDDRETVIILQIEDDGGQVWDTHWYKEGYTFPDNATHWLRIDDFPEVTDEMMNKHHPDRNDPDGDGSDSKQWIREAGLR